MRNKRFINRTGYTPGSKTENNPVNIIPSQDITMRNVPYPLQGIPLDQYGNPIGQSVMMMPNEDYYFENATFVEERPIPEMQMGGWNQSNMFIPQVSTEQNPNLYQPVPQYLQRPEQEQPFNGMPAINMASEGMFPNLLAPSVSATQGIGINPSFTQAAPNFTSQQSPTTVNNNQPENNGSSLYQFANPYGSQDFGTSLFNLGASINEGDGLGIAVNGLTTLTKGTKSFMQGMGASNRKNQNMRTFYDNFRQNMVGGSTYLQNGGQQDQEQLVAQVAEALQAGATPEEIISKLVESGFPQEEAVQIVQSIAQQMGGQQTEEQVMQQGGYMQNIADMNSFVIRKPQIQPTYGFGVTAQRNNPDRQMNQEEWNAVKSTFINDTNNRTKLTEQQLIESGLNPKNPADYYNNFLTENVSQIDGFLKDFRTKKMQEGGMQQDITVHIAQALQGGTTPEEILATLVQNGMPEEEATALIQQVLQSSQQPQFKNGGEFKKKAAVDAGIVEEEVPVNISNAEIEKNEYVFDSKGIRKAVGDTHEAGGIAVSLEQGAKVLSDHLKVGTDAAKELSEKLNYKVKPTLTYAKVLDVYNKESGIDAINNEIIKLTEQLEKQQKGTKDETTQDLNIEFLIGKIKEETDKKAPIEKEQQKMFNVLFDLQESSKEISSSSDYMEDGGIKTLAEKYNIPLEDILKMLPKYQTGGTNLTVNNTQSQFTNQPSATDWLPYTPREDASNSMWRGDAYNSTWVPLVQTSLADVQRAAQIEQWLMSNTQYSDNVQSQLRGLQGQERINRIQQLATDGKPGLFHNAFLEAVQQTVPKPTVAEVKTPESTIPNFTASGGTTDVQMAALNMPDRPINMPSWNPSLKVSTRLNRIDPSLISPEQAIAETDRAIASAQQDLQNLSPAMRALSNIGLTANSVSSNNKAIQESNRFNSQAQNQADVYNSKISDVEQQAENQNALNYEARTLQGLGNYERDLQNMQSQQFRDQVEKWKNVQIMNQNNALSPDAQWTGSEYVVNTPNLSDLTLNFTKTDSKPPKKTTKKKYGGRFKNK